jgi:hypothetical protein
MTIDRSAVNTFCTFAALAAFEFAVVEMQSSAFAQAPPAARQSTPPTSPATSPSNFAATGQTNAAPSEAQADKEWLTAYFMVHEGYKLHHMPAIDDTLNKMTPTQLHTLRNMYEQKHSQTMQQQATFNQWNAHKLAQAQAWHQQQQSQLNQISAEESQSASLAERQINQMHQEAAANAEAKSLSYPYPGMYGPYGGAYGYGGYGGYGRPYGYPY